MSILPDRCPAPPSRNLGFHAYVVHDNNDELHMCVHCLRSIRSEDVALYNRLVSQHSCNDDANPNLNARPPLGLKPRYIHEEHRLTEISSAITRFTLASKELPLEWVEEYNELAKRIESRSKA